MKTKPKSFPVLLVAAILSISGFSLALQQQSKTNQATVIIPSDNKQPSVETKDVSKLSRSTASNSASELWQHSISENTRLSKELDWVFGGTHQAGWSLYSALIANVVGANEASFDQPEFASGVAAFQKQNKLNTTSGIVDNDTWSRFVSYFQSRRIKDRITSNQLITIPVEDCYDPERPLELRQVDRATYDAYKRMVAAAESDLSKDSKSLDSQFFKIISAYRSPEYQAELHRRNPNATSAGLATNSPHRTGRAIDIYVGGDPVSTKDNNRAIQVATPAYKWLVKNAAKFGFQPYFYEPWHWKYNPETQAQAVEK